MAAEMWAADFAGLEPSRRWRAGPLTHLPASVTGGERNNVGLIPRTEDDGADIGGGKWGKSDETCTERDT